MLGVNWFESYLYDLKGGGWEKIGLLVAPLLILPTVQSPGIAPFGAPSAARWWTLLTWVFMPA